MTALIAVLAIWRRKGITAPMLNRNLAYGVSAAAILLATSSAAFAQETTGGIRGVITDASGAPMANATVVVTHVPSGTSTTTVTGADGGYVARNLRVGGPYVVTALTAQGEVSGQVPTVSIGSPTALNLTATTSASDGATTVADVVVRGVRGGGLITGPRTRVGAEDIETLPSISRDIKDFARTSPFASVDPTNSDALILGGQNSRTNAFLVDGIRQGDDFGLAGNGYPTVNSPISVSVLESVQVDVAPYDVQYGSFQGGVINSVTKSGGNQFHGELFYEETNDSLQGDSFSYEDMTTGNRENRQVTGEFKEKTWGATLSGPILQDRLFFLLNYEKFEAVRPVLSGPAGSGATNEVPSISQANVDTVRQITETVYGYDPLNWRADEMTVFDEKYFAKLDWNINDRHRAVVSYQQTEGSTLSLSGTSTSGNNQSVGLLSQGYNFQTNLTAYKAQLFSDWTDSFSTELSFSRKETENISSNLGGSDFAAMRVFLPSQGSVRPSIFLGPERSRHANSLTNDLNQYRLVGKYQRDGHRLTFGYEREDLEIYNVFVQAANAEYEFASVDAFRNGVASYINYQNAASNNKIDGGAAFKYTTNSLFAQDEFELNDRLTLRAGFRFDWFEMDDQPLENPAFENRYGFKNTHNLDGISLLQPRFGFNYRVDDTFNIYGGFGLFMGGSPNVWVSNNFSNPGNLIGQFQCRAAGYTSNNVQNSVPVCTAAEMAALQNVDGFDPAQIAKDRVTESAQQGTGTINVVDPTFQLPSIWKFSLGGAKYFDLSRWNMGEDWNVRAEYVHSEVENSVGWVDLNMAKRQTGVGPDGRPIYTGPNANQVVLMLTNFKGGDTDQFTVGVSKDWREGWAQGLGFDLSYTYVDANDVHPGTSSVAGSNYGQVAVFDPNAPGVATSNYEIEHSTKLSLNYRRAFFGDYRTSFALFGERRSGLPYSHTITNAQGGTINGEANEYARRGRMLLYVPTPDSSGMVTATSDPRVTYATNFDFAGFNNYLQSSGLMKYAGGAAPRNSSKSPDVTKFDLRIAQELPAFFPNGARLEAYMDIENLGNLLNDEWGVIQQVGFPYFSRGVTGSVVGDQFNYSQYRDWTGNSFNNQSVWQVKLGVRYKF
ncbi:Oar-like outer membrane protein protein, OmpA family [Brevundimonas diminuta 3F5N]|uniref:Oar-like outer membrane protein protein, OmpA family n=2 Tax=Brevundimonas diminuta TaxID=293 RepID=A0A1R4GCS7_BREDI|nr:Oar-like outer membrane protein protein, OmpA family [Brevundimonas diminuta 3F5N]